MALGTQCTADAVDVDHRHIAGLTGDQARADIFDYIEMFYNRS